MKCAIMLAKDDRTEMDHKIYMYVNLDQLHHVKMALFMVIDQLLGQPHDEVSFGYTARQLNRLFTCYLSK